jgi:DNA-binding Xre family transcriptional regulator
MPMRTEDVDDAPLFHYRVREIAEAKGINLTKLARLADVTRETAERYWNNKVTRPTQALIKLARALECKVEDLIVIVNPDELRPDGSEQSSDASSGRETAEQSTSRRR